MKKPYEKPEVKKVLLKPDEAVLACGKCPGDGFAPSRCNKIGLPTKQS